MKRIYASLAVLVLIFATTVKAVDHSGDNWVFGNNGGVSFATGSPVALAGSQMTTNEGCATLSDSVGNLLLYTDGIRVWNRNHAVMPNGTGLLGDSSSTQSAIVVPKPGSTTLLYLFTADTYPGGVNGLNYSIVDMTLDSGNGAIVTGQKNINLMTHCSEQLSATPTADNTGVWVMGRAINSNAIHAFLVTSSGVNSTPVISNVGTTTGVSGEVGYLKPSPSGTKLAMAYYITGKAELYNFDSATGVVSGAVGLGTLLGPYGVEFSPTGGKLYFTLINTGEVIQYDLAAGNIPASKTTIATPPDGNVGAMQLGPDGKIYIAMGGESALSVINLPEVAGTGCNFQLNTVTVSGTCTYGLPTFIASTFAPTTGPTLTTATVSAITATTASSGGDVTADGGLTVTARGVAWSAAHNPTTSGSHTTDGSGLGSFTSGLTGLTPGTTYYVRAYGINSSGTGYGNEVSFTTTATTPTLTTTSISSITATTASSGGSISTDGGASVTARGVCWSTSTTPTIADSLTSNGTGTGSFTSSLTGLSVVTTYFVRAYATNSIGTSYGNQVSFTTLATTPTLTTTGITSITPTTASSGGTITTDGGASVTARGVCWSTSPIPLITDSLTIDGTGTGSFTSSLTDLSVVTTYFVRAYATNSVGTVYGNEVSFTTPATTATLTTTGILSITATTASSGGNITTDGGSSITARGVCWSTAHNPTISDSLTSNSVGTGLFTSSMTGLTRATTYYVRAYAMNSIGTIYGNEIGFTSSTTSPTLTTDAITAIAATSATGGGAITDDGGDNVTARGVCWSTSPSPTVGDLHTADGTGTGSFISSLTALNPATIYYVRAYATNAVDTSYGLEVSFTTLITTATLTTAGISSISAETASSGGTVASDGGATVSARGVCWSTSPNPTVGDSHTTDGTGTGNFVSSLTGLAPGTTYYVRSYATNLAGTAYGSAVSFSTIATTPTLTAPTITAISTVSASASGNVTTDGGAETTAYGVCWSTSPNPTVGDSHTTDGSGTGNFISSLTGLAPGTTYYVRAYATNAIGTSFSTEISFSTPITAPDVVITSANTPDSVAVGDTIPLAFDVTNQGNGDATAVQFSFTVPDNVEFVSASLDSNPSAQLTPLDALVSGSTVTFLLGDLVAGHQVQVQIILRGKSAGHLALNISITSPELATPVSQTVASDVTVQDAYDTVVRSSRLNDTCGFVGLQPLMAIGMFAAYHGKRRRTMKAGKGA